MNLPYELWTIILTYNPYDISSHMNYKFVNKQFNDIILQLHNKIPNEITLNIETTHARSFGVFEGYNMYFDDNCMYDIKNPELIWITNMKARRFITSPTETDFNQRLKELNKILICKAKNNIQIPKKYLLFPSYLNFTAGCYENIFISLTIDRLLTFDYNQKCNKILIAYDLFSKRNMMCYQKD